MSLAQRHVRTFRPERPMRNRLLDVVRVFRPQQLPAAVIGPGALPPVRQGPLQPLLPPDQLHPLVVDAPALQPPVPAHMAPGQLTDPPAQLLLLDIRHRHGPALGVAVLARQPAGTALRRRSGLRSFPPRQLLLLRRRCSYRCQPLLADRFADAERVQRPALNPPSSPPAMGERAGCLAGAWASKIRPLRPLWYVSVGCPAESGRPPGQ